MHTLTSESGIRYDLLRKLSSSGMAELWLAQPDNGGEPVVVKQLRPALRHDAELVAAFRQEARIVTRLAHPNIARALDTLAGGDGLVLECLHGEDVGSVLAGLRARGQRMAYGMAAHIAGGVAAGLQAAHDLRDDTGKLLSVVHRDVSPGNIILTYDGQVKLLDFGIAKSADSEAATDLGVVKGKVPYMSPEQCMQAPLDRRSDLFSLGAVLYEMTTGRPPFGADPHDEPGIMERIVGGAVQPPSLGQDAYPDDLEQVVRRALATARELRYGSGLELAGDLAAVVRVHGWQVDERDVRALLDQLFGQRPPFWLERARASAEGEAGGDEETALVPLAPDLLAHDGAFDDDLPDEADDTEVDATPPFDPDRD